MSKKKVTIKEGDGFTKLIVGPEFHSDCPLCLMDAKAKAELAKKDGPTVFREPDDEDLPHDQDMRPS